MSQFFFTDQDNMGLDTQAATWRFIVSSRTNTLTITNYNWKNAQFSITKRQLSVFHDKVSGAWKNASFKPYYA